MEWNLPGIVACAACNPANGRVDCEDGRIIKKSSLIKKDEHEACPADQDQSPKKVYKETSSYQTTSLLKWINLNLKDKRNTSKKTKL